MADFTLFEEQVTRLFMRHHKQRLDQRCFPTVRTKNVTRLFLRCRTARKMSYNNVVTVSIQQYHT